MKSILELVLIFILIKIIYNKKVNEINGLLLKSKLPK